MDAGSNEIYGQGNLRNTDKCLLCALYPSSSLEYGT